MLTIYDGRSHFWQWDIGQKLIVDAGHACEVHFRNPDGATALAVDTYTIDGKTVANVPNILLQDDRSIIAWVYICEGDECTKNEARFEVWPRQKPADYVYSETEVRHYSDLEERIKRLEESGGGGTAFKTDETLSLRNGILSVNTTNAVTQDNTLPVTSAAVHEAVGNIEILLETI